METPPHRKVYWTRKTIKTKPKHLRAEEFSIRYPVPTIWMNEWNLSLKFGLFSTVSIDRCRFGSCSCRRYANCKTIPSVTFISKLTITFSGQGYSNVILPQLTNSTDPLNMDLHIGSWFGMERKREIFPRYFKCWPQFVFLAASVHSLSAPFGSFASGYLMDRYGRRPALIACTPLMVIGWLLIATAPSHVMLLAGRFSAGLGVGMLTGPAQVRPLFTVDYCIVITWSISPCFR